jgi:hypothetical protein
MLRAAAASPALPEAASEASKHAAAEQMLPLTTTEGVWALSLLVECWMQTDASVSAQPCATAGRLACQANLSSQWPASPPNPDERLHVH